MVKADLHVHSKASRRPSEWFLKKVGASESYTEIETLYQNAKQRGMDFVTVTDHNTIEGALELVEKHPEDCFISCEFTTYFPENNCKLHVLVYDITQEQFDRLNQLRHNIYPFREAIYEEGLAHSVAHGFYAINGKLNREILEKTILLFDTFEGLNGARSRYYNEAWQSILEGLTPERIRELKNRYSIEPGSTDPWKKGFTGGSDDHAGLFIAETHTACNCMPSKSAFLDSLKNKQSRSAGRCNDYKSFAFSIYKIFCDYSSIARKSAPGGILAFINTVVFEERQSRLKRWVTLRKIKKGKQEKDKIILNFFEDVYNWSHNEHLDMETKMAQIYRSMGQLLDEFFKIVLTSFEKDFAKGDIGKVFKNIMSAFPAFFISIPFFSSLKHLSQDRRLILDMKNDYQGQEPLSKRKVLWFSDTVSDLNGVSVTLGRFRNEMGHRKLNVRFVTCAPEGELDSMDHKNMMILPCMHSITPDFYTAYTMNFPSLLASMEMIYTFRPDRIVISTPGPVGVLGMIMAGVLGIEAVTIYHTDFAAQAELIFKDEGLAGFIQSVINRFYAFSTHIKVPTKEYIRILESQDYDLSKMSIFKRGFSPRPDRLNETAKAGFMAEKGIRKGFTLMWAGRVSKDKNIDFLIDTYKEAARKIPDLNLVLCGDGPDLKALKKACRGQHRIYFTGYVANEKLQDYYEISDLFVFPSTTDTFGMVILEAQAKGCYCLVTDVGGPQEIVKPGTTGAVIPLSDKGQWVEKILALHRMQAEQPDEYQALQLACRERIRTRFNWDDAIRDILGGSESGEARTDQPNSSRVNGSPGATKNITALEKVVA